MRRICLAFPDATEGSHFGETAFYVKGKLFASWGDKHGAPEITFGLEPEHAAALVRNDPRFRPYPRDRRGVVVDAAAVTDWRAMEELLRQSYLLRRPATAAKRKPLPKQKKTADAPVRTSRTSKATAGNRTRR